MTPQEVLLAAADLLEAEGWRQGNWNTDGHGPRCAVGAIEAVAPKFRGWTAKGPLREFIGTQNLEDWNDKSGQTAENVIATLRAAALP